MGSRFDLQVTTTLAERALVAEKVHVTHLDLLDPIHLYLVKPVYGQPDIRDQAATKRTLGKVGRHADRRGSEL